jgi:hypothetical protein
MNSSTSPSPLIIQKFTEIIAQQVSSLLKIMIFPNLQD